MLPQRADSKAEMLRPAKPVLDRSTRSRRSISIAAMSDLHGHLPPIPPCDLLILAGDICPDQGRAWNARHHPADQAAWFNTRVRQWLDRSPAKAVVLTWGNHDWCGQYPCRPLSMGKVFITIDDLVTVNGLTIWCSPWSNQFFNWAFMRDPEELAQTYADIPVGTDIIVSHQPPYGYGDPGSLGKVGSRELLATLDRVRPQAVVCGHLHSGYGQYHHGPTTIWNVAVVDEAYKLVRKATEFSLTPGGGAEGSARV